jgi:hypothetical protein
VELLGCVLGHAVHIDRRNGMFLVHRQVPGMPVDLTRGRVHDDGLGADGPQDLQERDLAAGVDVEVEHGLGHGLDVTDLAGQVEDHLGAARRIAHGAHVTDVGLEDADGGRDVLGCGGCRRV